MINDNEFMNRVAIIHNETVEYPHIPPFHPSRNYPEYVFRAEYLSDSNIAYDMVRECLKALRMDINNYGSAAWNPFKTLVKKGDSVVIKPNFVQDYHDTGGEIFSVITHGSIIRAIIDYVSIALENEGHICIADAPMMNSNFERIVEITGLREIADFYREKTNINISVVDLRVMRVDLEDGLVVRRHKLSGDPLGYRVVNLSENSMLHAVDKIYHKFRGSDYDIEQTIEHHNQDKHEYLISNTVLNADLFINVPKLKTHKKTGVSLNLKNLIGINGDKNWIPHYRIGGPNTSGDEFETQSYARHFESFVKEEFKKFVYRFSLFNPVSKKIRKLQKLFVDKFNITPIRAGGWYGNDTLWRSVIDLNLILLHLDNGNQLNRIIQRKYFSVVDGIIGAERNGPMNPEPKKSGVVIAGFSPITVDYCAIRLMGFDCEKIPLMKNIIRLKEYFGAVNIDDIEINSNDASFLNLTRDNFSRNDTLCFLAPDGWRDMIEIVRSH